jgi:hypothetical protein
MPPRVVREYRGRMLNIHPALLPAFGGRGRYGARIHRAVLDAGCTVPGVTVHFVDERYDTGPILLQWPVPVLPGDSVETLAKRVLDVEHLVLPAAVDALVEILVPGAGGEGGAGKDVVSGAAVTREAAPVRFGLVEERGPTEVEVRRLLEIEAERVDGED